LYAWLFFVTFFLDKSTPGTGFYRGGYLGARAVFCSAQQKMPERGRMETNRQVVFWVGEEGNAA
jgi:hypothetical protein